MPYGSPPGIELIGKIKGNPVNVPINTSSIYKSYPVVDGAGVALNATFSSSIRETKTVNTGQIDVVDVVVVDVDVVEVVVAGSCVVDVLVESGIVVFKVVDGSTVVEGGVDVFVVFVDDVVDTGNVVVKWPLMRK